MHNIGDITGLCDDSLDNVKNWQESCAQQFVICDNIFFYHILE